jgi:diaminobutyrate-2-oxoglutarate transaminase
MVRETLDRLGAEFAGCVRGRGLIQAIEFADPKLAGAISEVAFRRGLIIETAGRQDEVVKLLPPLTIDEQALRDGLKILEASVREVMEPVGTSAPVGSNGDVS